MVCIRQRGFENIFWKIQFDPWDSSQSVQPIWPGMEDKIARIAGLSGPRKY
jgi:hypothetical protein